jgi:sulfate permease, SulP family
MSGHPVTARARRLLPGWATRYRREWLPRDVVAGLTLAVMLVPQGMAYASLAGMPPITGLYAALVALVVYALLGTSSHLSFGPFALISLLTAAALEPLAAGASPRYVALAGALALMVGAIHLVFALARAGSIVELIAHPVVVGFTAAVGIVIGLSQVRDLTGVDVPRSERFLEAGVAAFRGLTEAHLPTLLIGLTSLGLLLLARRRWPQLPMALITIVVGTVAAVAFDLDEAGVRLVGDIPSGVPTPSVPLVSLADLRSLLPSAIVLAVIALAGNMSMAKSLAARTRERVSAGRELIASGTANAASGLFGGFPVSASFTRTVVVFNAGAHTQLAGLVAAVVLLLTLLVLTPLLEPLPRAILAAIVVTAVFSLIDVQAARAIVRAHRPDGAVMVVTFLATLGLGAELGLLVGVVTNLVVHVARQMRPALVVLGRVEGTTTYRNVERWSTVTDPEGVILRIDGSLDFLSVQRITGRIGDLAATRPELDWVVLVVSGVTDMDTTGLHALRDLHLQLRDADVVLHLATLRGKERDTVERAGLWNELVEGSCHADIPTALRAAGVRADAPVIEPRPDERRSGELL